MQRSETISKLAEALAKAQGEIKGATKDAANPFFKSRYADLASCWEACRQALSDNGIAVIQAPTASEAGVTVETMLAHSSGEWLSEILTLPVAKADAQGVGSAITYARRYGLCAMCGIAPEDDDGNAAAESVKNVRAKGLAILETASKKGVKALEEAWKALSPDMRRACATDKDAFKSAAMATENNHAPASV